MKINGLFGAAALLVAGAAIGGGAVVTQMVMASDDSPSTPKLVTVVKVAVDGDAVRCTFTGAEAASLVPGGVPDANEVATDVGGASGVGVIVSANGDVPDLSAIATAQIVSYVDDSTVVIGQAAVGSDEPGAMPTAAREGTAEECSAMRAATVDGVPAP